MEKKTLLIGIIVFLIVAFIFGQALLNQSASSKESSKVERLIVKIYSLLTGKKTLPFNVRTAAHFSEFLLLGFAMIFFVKSKKLGLRVLRSISYCGLIAFLDESIQLFSDRAAEVVDIWTDLFGAAAGTAIGFAVILLVNAVRKAKKA